MRKWSFNQAILFFLGPFGHILLYEYHLRHIFAVSVSSKIFLNLYLACRVNDYWIYVVPKAYRTVTTASHKFSQIFILGVFIRFNCLCLNIKTYWKIVWNQLDIMYWAIVTHKGSVNTRFIELLDVPYKHHTVTIHRYHSLIFFVKSDSKNVCKLCLIIRWDLYFTHSCQYVCFAKRWRP